MAGSISKRNDETHFDRSKCNWISIRSATFCVAENHFRAQYFGVITRQPKKYYYYMKH